MSDLRTGPVVRLTGAVTALVTGLATVAALGVLGAAPAGASTAPTAQASVATQAVAGVLTSTAQRPARTRRGPVVRLRALSDEVRLGRKVRLTGRTLAPRGAAVRIQVKVGKRGWRAAGRTRVNRSRRFAHQVKTSRTTGPHRFRACVARPRRTCSKPITVTVVHRSPGQQTATLRVDERLSGTREVGGQLTVAGSGSANLAGRPVQLQVQRAASAWTTLTSGRVAADGRFSLSGALTDPGRQVAVRVVAPATATTREAVADAGSVQVFGWYYLHDGGPVAEAAGDWCPIKQERPVAGVTVPRSIGFGINCKDVNWAEVALESQCRTFETRLGLSDDPNDTHPDVRYAARFLVDGAERFNQPEMAPGQVWDVSIDLTGARRLRLEVPFVRGPQGLAILGGARVYCAL